MSVVSCIFVNKFILPCIFNIGTESGTQAQMVSRDQEAYDRKFPGCYTRQGQTAYDDAGEKQGGRR